MPSSPTRSLTPSTTSSPSCSGCPPRDFWREVARNDSLHEFLGSYLQFRHMWYDFPHRGATGTVEIFYSSELQ